MIESLDLSHNEAFVQDAGSMLLYLLAVAKNLARFEW